MGNASKSKTKISFSFWVWEVVTFWFFFFQKFHFWKELWKCALWSVPSILRPAPCSWTRPGSGRHQRHRPSHTDRRSPVLWTGTLVFVVLKTLIDSDREMWVNSNIQTSSSGFPGIELGSGWSIAPQKGESIVITPTPFSVQSLLWLQCPCHLLTGGRNSAGVNSKMVRSGVWCWH